ncbi:hypothetical protein D3C84_833470 [compost metagenome]
MANRWRNVFQVVAFGSSDQTLQRQVVELHVTQHIGVNQLRDIGRRTCRCLLCGGMFANQQESHDAQDSNDNQRAGQYEYPFGTYRRRGVAGCRTARAHGSDVCIVMWLGSVPKDCKPAMNQMLAFC